MRSLIQLLSLMVILKGSFLLDINVISFPGYFKQARMHSVFTQDETLILLKQFKYTDLKSI